MYTVAQNPYGGLVTKADFKRGKGATPGTAAANNIAGDTKQYVAVKLASGTWINGTVLQIDTANGSAVAAAPASAPSSVVNARVGILVFASATATQTMAGTAYGWAQVYGQALARTTGAVATPAIQLVQGNDPGELITGAQVASGESQLDGITAIATQAASGLLNVFLNYPRFRGVPDQNLA
jgi:hypothetical protein